MSEVVGTAVVRDGVQLHMFLSPGVGSKSIKDIPEHAVLEILKTGTNVNYTNQYWLRCRYDGVTGWIYAKDRNTSTTPPTLTVYVDITMNEGSGSTTTPVTSEMNELPSTVTDNKSTVNGDYQQTGTSSGIDTELEKLVKNSLARTGTIKASMQLFGLPFQLMDSVDPRFSNISPTLGIHYISNIIKEAPILTIVPGKPKFLGNQSEDLITSAFRNVSSAFQAISASFYGKGGEKLSDSQLRYYDFEQDYLSYIQYVNMMCRVAAVFLGLEMKPLGDTNLGSFRWQNYRFTGTTYRTISGALGNIVADGIESFMSELGDEATTLFKNLLGMGELTGKSTSTTKTATTMSLDDFSEKQRKIAEAQREGKQTAPLMTVDEEASAIDQIMEAANINDNYVQFYIDPSSYSETSSNTTQDSALAGAINDKGGATFKEIQFIAGSSGNEETLRDIQNFAGESMENTVNVIQALGQNGLTTALSRIASVGSNVISGDTMIFPEIFMKNDYSRNFSVNINLKSPYGDKYSYYMNILVPLFHLLALTAPRQSTANTYSSPFIIRAYVPGLFNCMLGIVESINIQKNPSNDGLSIDGYPLDLQITLNIKDLYADLSIAPTSDPMLFSTNSGLIDFLAINCGLDITSPNYQVKASMILGNMSNYMTDILQNGGEAIGAWIDSGILNAGFSLFQT